ncbi:conserved oligomeric Golgi complex subunit 2 isoform X4 [Rissa tridactyla]|uniref:conserved oligomeric Golgi complex subunit 2 isoform X4 n=1 Tax=Rissa tridactyla TaxID=75485 RepID=UPI0023BA57F8|nr:conserved oligomeric Golgi complex subunit 2 isoform X4 [Rissa tridactyla]
MEGKKMNLPRGPENLCFDKDEFMKPDFDVDHFVSDCRKRVQLEELREDLELYYKLLKTAMVELINKDYADFVNLSTNLVGMDKALNQLSVPLGQLREEVMSLKSCVSEGIQAVDDRMTKQEDIRRKKMCVLRLIHVIQSVEKIEKILHSQGSKELSSLEGNSPLLTGQVLERIATEFNQLQFHAVQSKGMPLLDKVRPVIVEQYVQSHPNGLQAMYNRLLEFVPHHCRLLREVTGGAISSEKADIVPGYDFLVNSVWPEIVCGLEEKLPSLFNPGNPDVFHEKYTTSMDFVRKFERQCGSQASVKRLRSHPSYQSFNNKWNLPVYFQIRFREIAGALEEALSDTLEEAPAGSSYCLLATHMVWMSLLKCWSDQMFLPLLAHRLWKLSLQILARYSVFIGEVSVRPISCENMKESKKSVPVGRKESSVSLSPGEDQGNGSSPESQTLPSISSTQLVYVAADLDKLQDQIPDILEMIKPKLEMIGFKNVSCLAGALEDSKTSLSACIPTLNNRIIQDLSESSFAYLKSALEVPRLYRRTNKEVPTKASPYVDSALKPFYRLQNEYKDILKQPMIHQWLEGALSESTQKYYETVSDVLSSVKKMEESLKRLKQARRNVTSNPVGTNGGMSDDNKIRLQLALDVEYFGEQIRKMGLETSSIKSFSALTELVLTAKDQATAEQS